jgi:hypothetical protein
MLVRCVTFASASVYQYKSRVVNKLVVRVMLQSLLDDLHHLYQLLLQASQRRRVEISQSHLSVFQPQA